MDFRAFAGAALKLKGIRRTGWLKSGIPSPESVAGHSFSVALISMALCDWLGAKHNIDRNRLLTAALLHDLGEAEVGDKTEKTDADWEAEKAALEKIVSALPELKDKYSTPLASGSKEAAILKAADGYDMLLQAEAYLKSHSHPYLGEIRESARRKIKEASGTIPELEELI